MKRCEGELLATPFNKGARLVGADDDEGEEEDEGEEVVDVQLDEEMDGMNEVAEVEDGEEITWIVPATVTLMLTPAY